MNFKIEDTAWAIGVGASVLSFLFGLFTAFSLAGSHIFIVNLLLLLVATASILSGIALLLAATEVYMKLHRNPETKLSKLAQKFYRNIMGEELDILKAYQVLEAADVNPQTMTLPAVELVEEEVSTGNNADLEPNAFTPMTPEQIIAASLEADILVKAYQENIHVPSKPMNKPVIHSLVDTEALALIDPAKPEEEIMVTGETMDSVETTETPVEVKEADISGIITIGPGGFELQSKEFKIVLHQAMEKASSDASYELHLQGKTYGIGARGQKKSDGNTDFVAFGPKDIEKIYKKLNS